jgi:transcriptional regulator with XRE-family HTH domain
MAAKDFSNFGEWLKIRRLAAEMTPVDIARAIGMDLAVYRELEAGRGGLTEAQIALLIKIERMRITRRDVDHARPTILAEDGAPSPEAQDVGKAQSALDTIIASVQARHERQAATAAMPTSPLAAYLLEKGDALGLSRLELARRCRIAPMDLDDIEKGFVPGPTTLKGIAAGLGVDPAELLDVVQA